MRVKRGNVARKRRKKVLKRAKGFVGSLGRLFGAAAKFAVIHAGVYAYRDRRNKKRTFRNLWVIRLNAAARENGLSYSRMINMLKKAGVILDRKVLSDIAATDSKTFSKIIEAVK
jgi:large subunit ribosomal protein L20